MLSDVDDPARPRDDPVAVLRRDLFGRDVGQLLRTGRNAVQSAQSRPAHDGTQLSPAQLPVLFAIVRVPGITQRQVCELASLSPAATSAQVARLAAAGRVVAVGSDRDRRRAHLHATAPAQREAELSLERLVAAEEWLLEPLDRRERDRLLEMLERTGYTEDERRARSRGVSAELTAALSATRTFGRLVRVGLQRYGSAWSSIAGNHTLSAHALIRVVDALPAHPQRLVGACLDTDATSVAGLVSRLQVKGLLAVTTDEKDRRRRLLALTPRGRDVLADGEAARTVLDERHLRSLGPGERHDLVDLLARTVLRPDAIRMQHRTGRGAAAQD